MNSGERYKWQEGTWTLIAPDGCLWQGDSPIAALRAEMNSRIPPTVQLANIQKALAEDDPEWLDIPDFLRREGDPK